MTSRRSLANRLLGLDFLARLVGGRREPGLEQGQTGAEESQPADVLGLADPAPEPLDPLHEAGLRDARRHSWSWAQRRLEEAVRSSPEGGPAPDLASVREIRRLLRQLQKRPRDAQLHFKLGREYLALEMPEDGERELRRALELAPDLAEAWYTLALEQWYRGDAAEAQATYARARALVPALPEAPGFDAVARAAASEGGLAAAG